MNVPTQLYPLPGSVLRKMIYFFTFIFFVEQCLYRIFPCCYFCFLPFFMLIFFKKYFPLSQGSFYFSMLYCLYFSFSGFSFPTLLLSGLSALWLSTFCSSDRVSAFILLFFQTTFWNFSATDIDKNLLLPFLIIHSLFIAIFQLDRVSLYLPKKKTTPFVHRYTQQ